MGICAVPLSDLECLGALDALDLLGVLPEPCDSRSLAGDGLIEPGEDGRWRLTVKGRLLLTNLRSLERQSR